MTRVPSAAGRAALVGLVAGPLVLAVAIVGLGLATSGYDASAETVSALGAPGRPWAWAARLVLAGYGAVVALAAPGLGSRVVERRTVLVGCVVAFGAGAAVAGAFPKGVMGTPPTTSGHVHVVAALVGTASLLVAMWIVARGAAVAVERAVAWVALVLVALGSVVFRQTWGTEWYGVAERVVLGAAVCWLAAEAWWALRPRAAPLGADR